MAAFHAVEQKLGTIDQNAIWLRRWRLRAVKASHDAAFVMGVSERRRKHQKHDYARPNPTGTHMLFPGTRWAFAPILPFRLLFVETLPRRESGSISIGCNRPNGKWQIESHDGWGCSCCSPFVGERRRNRPLQPHGRRHRSLSCSNAIAQALVRGFLRGERSPT